MEILTCGDDLRLCACREYLHGQARAVQYDRILLFPIPTRWESPPECERACRQARAGTLAVGYAFSPALCKQLQQAGCVLCDVSRDETFVRENAKLTALGAVGVLLTSGQSAPDDWRVGVIGYGRIGETLVRVLLFLGARVTVYTGRESVRRMLGQCGIDSRPALYGEEQTDFTGQNILINTAPARTVVHPEAGVRILELASGENMGAQLKYEKLACVPARMFPKSAGRALGEAILRMSAAASPP